MNVLIVESDSEIRQALKDFLKRECFRVEEAGTFTEALEKVNLYDYDCMLMETALPDGNGLHLISALKSRSPNSCVIIVSECQSVDDKIRGLDMGADDYLAKPIDLAELIARIKSVLRRRNFVGCKEAVFHELRVNTESHQVFVNRVELMLTPKEYDLLMLFMMNKDRVLTRTSIVEHLWGDMMGITADSFDFLYTHVRNLRHKIKEAGGSDYLHTVYSVGYKFTDR